MYGILQRLAETTCHSYQYPRFREKVISYHASIAITVDYFCLTSIVVKKIGKLRRLTTVYTVTLRVCISVS